MDLKRLLNPICTDSQDFQVSKSPPLAYRPVPSVNNHRRHKVPKDAPVFSEGNRTVGIVNFRPHEAGDDLEVAAHHRIFSVFPLGEIERKGVRHIPYNSDKKDFLEKTGRDAFEVFQYTYKLPHEDKEYTVVWDYNVGLVRMTPFFKSCKYTKTIPAKALRENAGLKEISYSITGGALVCQGYWMPYHAARAVASTFCWDIRWALTPVFGNAFVSECLPPDHPSFADFKIDPYVVQFCLAETERFRREGLSYSIVPRSLASLSDNTNTQLSSPPLSVRSSKQRRLRAVTTRTTHEQSGYGMDTKDYDIYLLSPDTSPRTQPMSQPVSPLDQSVIMHSAFTPVNVPVAPRSIHAPASVQDSSPVLAHTEAHTFACERPSPLLDSLGHFDSSEALRTKRTYSKVAVISDHEADVATCRHQSTSGAIRYDSGQESDESDGELKQDLEAAAMLLSLSGLGGVPPSKKTRRGSRPRTTAIP
ncbi:hypothetical protein ACN47E_003871 [Coniothyrium glycines]